MGLALPVPAIRRCWHAAALAMALCASPQVLAQQTASQPRPGIQRPLVLVPGLLGSRLCRPDPKNPKKTQVVWGTVAALKQFPTIRLSHQPEAHDPVRPCGIIREIVYLGVYVQDVYSPIVRHLEKTGYREGRDLFVFSYDWRRSAFDNAKALDAFIREEVPDGKVDILAHSMGALVARVYVAEGGGGERVARLFSAGAPFQGSVKVFQTVQKGWGALNPAMGGLDGFRRTMLSFPSIFELMPRYHDCCGNTADAFDPARGDMWTALHWDGVETTTMPDLNKTFQRIRKLETLVVTPMPRGVEDVLLVGLDQRTPQRAAFRKGEGAASLTVQHSWAGDGTVIRDSAVIAQTPFYPTSFADHQRILHDPQIQDFLRVALTENVARAIATVPVRERGRVLSIDGSPTELVGVMIEPDQPIYRTGDVCTVHVHLRLGDRTSVDPARIKLTRRMPDGRDITIPLQPDPSASDPSNPFERSFVGQFDAGVKPGHAVLQAVLELAGAKPRVVETTIPVMAQ